MSKPSVISKCVVKHPRGGPIYMCDEMHHGDDGLTGMPQIPSEQEQLLQWASQVKDDLAAYNKTKIQNVEWMSAQVMEEIWPIVTERLDESINKINEANRDFVKRLKDATDTNSKAISPFIPAIKQKVFAKFIEHLDTASQNIFRFDMDFVGIFKEGLRVSNIIKNANKIIQGVVKLDYIHNHLELFNEAFILNLDLTATTTTLKKLHAKMKNPGESCESVASAAKYIQNLQKMHKEIHQRLRDMLLVVIEGIQSRIKSVKSQEPHATKLKTLLTKFNGFKHNPRWKYTSIINEGRKVIRALRDLTLDNTLFNQQVIKAFCREMDISTPASRPMRSNKAVNSKKRTTSKKSTEYDDKHELSQIAKSGWYSGSRQRALKTKSKAATRTQAHKAKPKAATRTQAHKAKPKAARRTQAHKAKSKAARRTQPHKAKPKAARRTQTRDSRRKADTRTQTHKARRKAATQIQRKNRRLRPKYQKRANMTQQQRADESARKREQRKKEQNRKKSIARYRQLLGPRRVDANMQSRMEKIGAML